jgi:hypothetical protein
MKLGGEESPSQERFRKATRRFYKFEGRREMSNKDLCFIGSEIVYRQYLV